MSKVKLEIINGIEYYVLDLGEMSRSERALGRWRIARKLNKKMVYLGCPYCNAICELAPTGVNAEGFIRAHTCAECGNAFRSKLLYWKEYLEEAKGGR